MRATTGTPYGTPADLNQYDDYSGSAIPTDAVSDITFPSPETWNSQEQQRVTAFMAEIPEAKSEARYVATNAAFSHQLPEIYTQQYYELIGKYGQYAPGWYDCSDSCTINEPSVRLSAYAAKRARANELLRRASRLVLGAVANHITAAADAAVSAHLHNVDFRSSFAISPGQGNQYHTVLAVRFSF